MSEDGLSTEKFTTEILKIAKDVCYNRKNSTTKETRDHVWCDLIFDGYMCWPGTQAGQFIQQRCQNDYLYTNNSYTFATKECLQNGTWLETDYTKCGLIYIHNATVINLNSEIYKTWVPIIKYLSYFGYTISIAAALIALIIFLTIKKLDCARNKLHIHLFLSFVMRACMYLIKNALFVKGTAMNSDVNYLQGLPDFNKQQSYTWICKALISLQQYFIMSNFTFILMEGVYLHNLMFLNLFSYHSNIKIYYIIGWGLPILFVIPWIILKCFYENIYCWTSNSNLLISLLIDFPIALTVVINFLLFLIIIRVLFVKINSVCVQVRRIRYRKLLKATLFLIPFFGIPYTVTLIMSFWVEHSVILEIIWLMIDQSFSAFQGLFAALVYCFLNGDVQTEIKRKYGLIQDRHNKEFRRSRTISQTQQTSLHHSDEHDLQQNHVMDSKKISECYF